MAKRVQSTRGTLTAEQRRCMREAYDVAEAHKEDIIQEGREWLEAARQRLAFLREAREKASLSLEQVAQRMGVHKSNLAKLEVFGQSRVRRSDSVTPVTHRERIRGTRE